MIHVLIFSSDSCFQIAATGHHKNVIKLLLDEGVEVDATTDTGE